MIMHSRRSRDIDGGWSWVVLAAAFVNLLIGPSLAYTMGIFQTIFLETFQESVALTSWVTSLFASLMQLAGPASSAVSSYFTCRVSVMAGSVLLSAGLFLSSFVHNIHLLLVSMGVVAGTGLGLTYSASVVIVNLYFVKMRTFITGLVLSATGAGCLLMPLLCRCLLDMFSWRETLSILAGVSLQMVICGALMFPIHEEKAKNKGSACMCLGAADARKQRKSDNKSENKILRHTGTEHEQMLENIIDPELGVCSEVKPLQNTAVTESPSMNNSDLQSRLREDRSLVSNIGFLILCANLFFLNASCGIYLIHFPSFAQGFSVTSSEIAFAMGIEGLTLTISRILLGALGNDDRIDPLSVYVGVLIIAGVIIFVTPVFATTATTQIATMALYGLYFGGSYSFLTTLTIDCVGLEHLTAAFGWEMICAGSGYLVAPPIAGWIVDTTGIYDNSIYLSGGFTFMSVFVVLLVPVFRGRSAPHPLHHPENETAIINSQARSNSIHQTENGY